MDPGVNEFLRAVRVRPLIKQPLVVSRSALNVVQRLVAQHERQTGSVAARRFWQQAHATLYIDAGRPPIADGWR
jgi:hypothetical protein